MKVKDIQIDGFGVWTGLSVDSMREGMTLFYGPNEAGKTTLMQFLRAMLYGFTSDRREKYLPPVFGGTPGGAIRVTGPGGGYQIRRHSQLTDQGINGQLTVTGQDGLVQGQHRLTTLLGQIDEAIFTNVFAIGMRELQELSTLDDTAAADELYKLSSGLDRVSLVDVLRSLRDGRASLVGDKVDDQESESAKLLGLIRKREKLRDEVRELTRGGRRWSELASQRRSQSQEIEQLTSRLSTWEHESRCVEIATSVFETWNQRAELIRQIEQLERETDLPDEAPGQLVQIDAMMDERRQRLEEVKKRRRSIREKAGQLPVSRRMLDLQARIEAASEQATWVEALEEQIGRLEVQIEKATNQLESDAERLGIDEEDRLAILEGDTQSLPDLSRQSLGALAGPAKQVKKQMFLMRQARNQANEHQKRSEKLAVSLRQTLDKANATNLQQAIRKQTESISMLRHRVQLGEHLDKLKRHYRDLERETIELTTAEALPVDRLILLAVPFIFGGMSLIYGVAHVFGFTWLVSQPDPTWGMLCILMGSMGLLLYYFGRENGERAIGNDREDCERQIDALRRQIREVESEKNKIDAGLPEGSESLEIRVREKEQLLVELEASLPTYHNHEAAIHAFKAARAHASEAADELKKARREWSRTLEQLGLSDSMSPSSIRDLSEGYENLQASRRRLDELKTEKQQRQRERKTISKRIEALYLEALEVHRETTTRENADDDQLEHDAARWSPSRTGPLEQLNHLHEELSRQQHWIKRRRELKEQDQQLKRQQIGHQRALERGEQQRRALWAKCGVATAPQFYEMVDKKATLNELQKKRTELNGQIKAIIGNHIDYDDVVAEIEGASEKGLETRWDALAGRLSETEARVAQLRTQQGELAQEMKQLGEDRRLSVAQLDLECTERRIDAVCQRWQTLAMASCLLEDVCGTFERERQPETLREASTFLHQLTDGKYTRIWTPLGTNQLKIDDAEEKSLRLDVLSRGTREAVFIALRLSLAAAYARRGVMLPLILDDVLVNFDGDRAVHAARTLKTFAELGHQVIMFTCHQHIVDIFQGIDVEVRAMPAQGIPGRATVLTPETYEDELFEDRQEEEDEPEEPVQELVQPEDAEEQDLQLEETAQVEEREESEESIKKDLASVEEVAEQESFSSPERTVEKLPDPPKPRVVMLDPPRNNLNKQVRSSVDCAASPADETNPPQSEVLDEKTVPGIGWTWFEREPVDRLDDVEDALASITNEERLTDPDSKEDVAADEDRERSPAWWGHS